MADAVAFLLLDNVCNRLDSHATVLSRSTNFTQMRLKLAEMQALLEDSAAEHGEFEPNSSLGLWFAVLRDLPYDVDGVIDNWEQSEKNKITCSLSSLVNRSKLEQKVKSINLRLGSLLNSFYKFSPDESVECPMISEVGSSRYDESVVFGRDFEISNVVTMMFSDIEEDELRIIPIVGMGGIGKTILARRIYNKERVKSSFQFRVWVSVGETLDVDAIAEAIRMECGKSRGNKHLLEPRAVLEGKRFLIVLDDVWDEDEENMEKVKSWLSVGDSGSCILVTTRSGRVATALGTTPAQHLTCLADKDSWAFFKYLSFGSTEGASSGLEEVGRNIVAKCKGLPIAIKTVGGLLRSLYMEEWFSLVDRDLWTLPEFQSLVLPVLKRSYDHLPWHLKQCFAYCSIFPKDHWINKEKLIQLWVAEGFILLDTESEDLQKIADDYFKELVQHSFFHDIVKDDLGEVVACRTHDFIHDLAQLTAGIEYSIVSTGDSQNVHADVRHCSFVGDFSPTKIPRASKLRTLLLLSVKLENMLFPFKELLCLRALDLSQSGMIKLPFSIGRLKHLRYLNISHTYIRRIPESIGNLKHLETLEVSNCYNLEELPKAICQLTNLRALHIKSCCSLVHIPSGIGKLRLLRKLPSFVVGKRCSCAGLRELKQLDLQGRLDIKNLENVKNLVDPQEAKLDEKVHIHSLGLSWSRNDSMKVEIPMAELLEILRPPLDLKVLDLRGYRGSMFPSWLNSGLPNLAKISLVDCSAQELPPLGQLPNLKDLYIKGMSSVQIIGYEFYGSGACRGFPSLQRLQLYDMANLLEWKGIVMEETDGLTQELFPSLENLVVEGCSKLTGLPHISNLKNLALCNSNEMLLHSLSHLSSLCSLVVDNFPELKFFPDDNKNVNSITKLTVHECDDLETLFKIVQSFSSLRQLSILHCKKMGYLPSSLKYFSSLQKLDVVDCPRLFHIPDIPGQLCSLVELTIDDCPKLMLPPKSIRFLSNLQNLVIRRCPKLERQLQMQTEQIEDEETDIDAYEDTYED